MADIKIFNMVEATSIIDTDLIVVEDSADTKKITKANFKETMGINNVYTKAEVDTNIYTKAEVDGFVEPITYDNAGAHNSIYRGKYLGSSVTTLQYANIANGTFEDLYIGDYWTIGGVNYRIANFNYYLRSGDTDLTTNHVTIVPDTPLYSAIMNTTNTTTGGYSGSQMRTTNLASAITTIKSAFSGHVLNHRLLLTTTVIDGKALGWSWFSSEVELMSEVMVYGMMVWEQSVFEIGVAKSQLALFFYRQDLIGNRNSVWLRNVISATSFANVGGGGDAYGSSASSSRSVRPAFSIY